MARKKKVTTVIEEPEAVKEYEDFAEIPVDDLPADVNNVLAEIGADVTRVVCYRRLKGEKQAYVGTIDAEEFSLDECAARWGGGRYLARLIGPGGIMKGVTFYIDESIKPTPKEDPLPKSGAMAEKLFDKVLDKMDGAHNGRDPMEIAAQMQAASASQAQAMVAAMMAAIAPLLAKITEMGAGGGKGVSSQDMLALIEFGADRFGDKGDTGLAGVVRDVGLPLVSIAERALGGRGATPALPPTTGGPPVTQPLPNPPRPAWAQAIAPYIGQVVDFASRNGDPATLAGVIDVQMPRFARWLENAVQDPAFPDQLFAQFPQLAQYREWVGRLLVEYTPDDDSDDAAGGSAVTGPVEPESPDDDD